jgi:hypothetical protein
LSAGPRLRLATVHPGGGSPLFELPCPYISDICLYVPL